MSWTLSALKLIPDNPKRKGSNYACCPTIFKEISDFLLKLYKVYRYNHAYFERVAAKNTDITIAAVQTQMRTFGFL